MTIKSCYLFTTFFCLTLLPSTIFAYIDPGTGSYFLQMLIAGLLGSLFAIKMFWGKIKEFFQNLFKSKDKDVD